MKRRLGVGPFIECCMSSSAALFVNLHGHNGVLSGSFLPPPASCQHLSIRFLFFLAMFAVLPPLFMWGMEWRLGNSMCLASGGWSYP